MEGSKGVSGVETRLWYDEEEGWRGKQTQEELASQPDAEASVTRKATEQVMEKWLLRRRE